MKTLLLFFAGILSIVSFAQDGSLDTSFGSGGLVRNDFGDSQDFGYSLVQQSDEKLLVAGSTNLNSNLNYAILLRYMPDGSFDSSFGTGGQVLENYGSGGNVYEFLFLEDSGRIVAAGRTGINFTVAKYLTDGTLDNTFGNNGILTIPNEIYLKMELLGDGSFLLFKTIGGTQIIITHYLSDGTLDIPFGVNGSATSIYEGGSFTFRELKADAENNLFVLGTRNHTDTADILLMKFLSTGYLDVNFGNNGVASKTLDAIIPMSYSSAGFDFTNEGKIIIAGSYGGCINNSQPSFQPFFMKYLNEGSPDLTFGNNGTVMLPISGTHVTRLMIQENQRLLPSGVFQIVLREVIPISKDIFLEGF